VRRINFEGANGRDAETISIEGGAGCHGDKSREHEVWLLRQRLLIFVVVCHLVFLPPLLQSSQCLHSCIMFLFPAPRPPPHRHHGDAGGGRGLGCFFIYQDHRQSHGLADEWGGGDDISDCHQKTSPSCSRLVCKCKDVLTAHTHTHRRKAMTFELCGARHCHRFPWISRGSQILWRPMDWEWRLQTLLQLGERSRGVHEHTLCPHGVCVCVSPPPLAVRRCRVTQERSHGHLTPGQCLCPWK